ncbi:MAG: DUF721 domain-containing protein [Candidatus Tumulicola sp.]
MLRPLNEALGRWSPEKGARWTSDPLSLLSAGWSEIVGDDVARNTHPARILDDALWVTTRSSAWSQQLTFLADRILAAVRARLPQTPVERLRFRVGKLPMRARLGPRGRQQAPPVKPDARAGAPAPADAPEALQRFRTSVEAMRRAKLLAGWKECRGCGAPVAAREGLCATCRNVASQQREAATARLLFEAPWLGYDGAAEMIDGLTPPDYEAIRNRLLSRWWETLVRARAAKRLSRDGRERTIASSYVVLKSKLSPEAIDPATVRNVLGDELNDLLYGTER